MLVLTPTFSVRERTLAAVFAALAAAALLGPALPTPASLVSADFADARSWGAMPNAADVLSNLPFALFGALGMLRLWRIGRLREAMPADVGASAQNRRDARNGSIERNGRSQALACARLFFCGLLATAVGSSFFHLAPDALRLAADRAGMAIAFAGLIGLAVCGRVSGRAGAPAALATLVGGLLAIAVCHANGNVLPWALVQFGGLGLVLWLALLRPLAGAVALRLGWVIFFYALAKLFELGDEAIYRLTEQLVSGHSLKHLTASLAALPVLQALGTIHAETMLRHNRARAALAA